MKKVIFLLLAFLYIESKAQDTVKVRTAATPEQQAEADYNLALEKMAVKNYSGAIEDFTKAISAHPAFEKAYIHRGFAHYENKDNNAAMADFDKANSLKPSSEAMFGKAQSLYSLGKKDESEQELNKATMLEESNYKAWYLLGQLKFERQDYKEAIADYDKAIAAKTDYAYAYNDRASAKKQNGDEAGALADYQKAVSLDNKLFFAYNNLGSMLRNKGDYAGAIDAYNKAIAAKPDYYIALNNRGTAKLNNKQYDEALSDFNSALKIKPDYIPALNNMASAYIKKKDYKSAVEWSNKAITLDSKSGNSYINRGIAKQMLKDEEGACADWKKAAELGVALGRGYSSGLCD